MKLSTGVLVKSQTFDTLTTELTTCQYTPVPNVAPPQQAATGGSTVPAGDRPVPPVPDLPGQTITPADLAGMLKVSKKTVERWRKAGKIGPQAIPVSPQTIRYDLAECVAWVRNRRPDGPLHDAKTWPQVWRVLQARGRK
jgi:hypothetical protein